METTTALLFTAYMVPVNLLDNILKPIVMTRGLRTPMLVIAIGVIGGTLSYGITGLFLGPIVLTVIWELIAAWIAEGKLNIAPKGNILSRNPRFKSRRQALEPQDRSDEVVYIKGRRSSQFSSLCHLWQWPRAKIRRRLPRPVSNCSNLKSLMLSLQGSRCIRIPFFLWS